MDFLSSSKNAQKFKCSRHLARAWHLSSSLFLNPYDFNKNSKTKNVGNSKFLGFTSMYIIQTFDLKVLKSHKMISIWSHPQRKERNHYSQIFVLKWKVEDTPGPCIMRIHLVRNTTSARFEKKHFNIHLVRIYSTGASEKNYILI